MKPTFAWEAEEDAKLCKLAAQGLTAVQIGDQLNRSSSAVHNRAKRLRIKLGKATIAAKQKPVMAFAIGERVRLSALGLKRSPKIKGYFGSVIGKGGANTYYVHFDGMKSARPLHASYLISDEIVER